MFILLFSTHILGDDTGTIPIEIEDDSMSGEAPLCVIAAIERKDDTTKLVALLSDRRVDPNEQNEYGETPLLIASRQGSADLCAVLLARGAVVDETDGAGFTSLHRACDYGHIEVVRALLAHSPNVNAITNRDRLTPCHLAARRGFGPIVRTLVGAGADLSRRDSEGRRPVDEAARYGHKAVVDGIASSFHDTNGVQVAKSKHRKRIIISEPAPGFSSN